VAAGDHKLTALSKMGVMRVRLGRAGCVTSVTLLPGCAGPYILHIPPRATIAGNHRA
jgi:hypothetical protein